MSSGGGSCCSQTSVLVRVITSISTSKTGNILQVRYKGLITNYGEGVLQNGRRRT